jgi:vacuolar-type H+-ATPase catalytic subunit A/Vma1
MSNPVKNRVKADLEQAKAEGQVRVERLREIIKAAVSQSVGELQEGSGEIRLIVRDAIAALIESLNERGKHTKEEVIASVEGLIEGVSRSKQEAISKTEQEIQKLQSRMEQQEQELDETMNVTVSELESASSNSSTEIKELLLTMVERAKNTEEASLLRKRYSQLQTQLAILKANLALRYGDRFDDVKRHLDSAKVWHESAKSQSEKLETGLVGQKQSEFEEKLGQAGGAVARKEMEVKRLLKELWHVVTEK